MRPGGRRADELRAVRMQRGYTKHAEGSVLVEFGDTRVLCTATVEERVPPFLKDSGRGWVTAEYIYQGAPLLDLDYAEDSACGCDMNVVMTGAGNFVEVQGTAEGAPFARAEMDALLALAGRGVAELVRQQKLTLGL